MADEVWTVAEEAHHEIKIERSRFIGHCTTAVSEQEAREFIAKIRQQYADATHNCYAYRVGSGTEPIVYYHDHGEPSGTAGKPILNAILQAELQQTVVVVTRYFGGKKLGVRGLIDAYHQTAAELLSLAGRRLWVNGVTCRLTLPYAQWAIVQREIEIAAGAIRSAEYTDLISCHLWIPRQNWEYFCDAIKPLNGITLEETLYKADGHGSINPGEE